MSFCEKCKKNWPWGARHGLCDDCGGPLVEHPAEAPPAPKTVDMPYMIGASLWPGLAKIQEEAGELLEIIGKIQGCGGRNIHWDGSDLRGKLMDELPDVMAAIEYAISANKLPRRGIIDRYTAKLRTFIHWHNERTSQSKLEYFDELDELCRQIDHSLPFPSAEAFHGTRDADGEVTKEPDRVAAVKHAGELLVKQRQEIEQLKKTIEHDAETSAAHVDVAMKWRDALTEIADISHVPLTVGTNLNEVVPEAVRARLADLRANATNHLARFTRVRDALLEVCRDCGLPTPLDENLDTVPELLRSKLASIGVHWSKKLEAQPGAELPPNMEGAVANVFVGLLERMKARNPHNNAIEALLFSARSVIGK